MSAFNCFFFFQMTIKLDNLPVFWEILVMTYYFNVYDAEETDIQNNSYS